MNKVILLGRLVKDVELKQAKQLTLAEGSLAVSGNADGSTVFIDFTAFGKTAEALALVKKGNRILVEGRLILNKFEKKDGTKVSQHKIVIQSFDFIEKKEGGAGKEDDESELFK